MRIYVRASEAGAEDFQTIEAGETVAVQWDVAEVHDLSAGGAFDIAATGYFKYTSASASASSVTDSSIGSSLEIAGEVPYSSNVLTAQVDGASAARVRRDWHDDMEKRTAVQSDCSTSQRSTISTAIGICRTYASNAATAASSGSDAKVTEYFKSATSSTRSTVSSVFSRVASECSSSSSGNSRTCKYLLKQTHTHKLMMSYLPTGAFHVLLLE